MPAKTKTEEIVRQVERLFAQSRLLELRLIQAHGPVHKLPTALPGRASRGES